MSDWICGTVRPSIEGGKAGRMSGLLADLAYLERMLHLELHPEQKSMDVVPVSGLVVSSLVRKESEMKTVLEVWDKGSPQVTWSATAEVAAAPPKSVGGGGKKGRRSNSSSSDSSRRPLSIPSRHTARIKRKSSTSLDS